MMDFDSLKSDILKDTFDLIDDIKSGRDLDFRKMKLFSKPIDSFFSSPSSSASSSYDPRRRNSNQRVNDLKHRFSSIPSFSTFKRTTTTDSDRDNDTFKRTNVKRSESTYSTGSYETTDSNETLSEMSDSSFSPGSSKSRSSGHVRTNSSSSDSSKVAELSKKLEENFLKDERHSMPHEMYSKCDRTLNDLDRPRSVPLNTGNPNISKNWKDSDSNFKCFPSKVMNSRDLGTYSQGRHISNGYDSDSRSTVTGSGSRLNSMSSFDFPSLSDRMNEFDGESHSPLLPTSPLSPRSPVDLTSPHLPNPPSYELSRNIYKSDPGGLPATNSLKQDRQAWEERTNRIQDALKWLRSELGSLRAQDKALLSSLSRCQDTIEDIKKQRTVLNENDEDDLEEDEDEEEDHWEDWEIAEFDRQCREKDVLNNKLNPSTGTGSSRLSGSDIPIRQDIQAVV
ncbi:uncharacterized protein LOC117316506 [Pecten maximus]|uniref:uncharacterized protein LOC117316506 n=1 Tax=Pecten maximus TaxID=6579 RepID=UPI0014586DFD|nr:uncharacterized protein LOC117316506 [Pecten maximus]